MRRFTVVDERIKEWATATQKKYIDAVNEHGAIRVAARALGVQYTTVAQCLRAAKRTAASWGYSPEHDMTRPAPSPFVVKGVSTYYDKEGKPSGQWVKTRRDALLSEELAREIADSMAETLPRAAATIAPDITQPQLCNVYTLTDSHVGMLAWHKEGGADWDLKIAEKVLYGCFEQMILNSPPAAVGLVNQLGDFLHTDGMTPVTPSGGHVLDADGRFSKIVQAAVRILRRVIDLSLKRHDRVVVLMAEGNHDPASSIWLRAMFRALYENEPRVEVIDSEMPYYAYQHGNVMLAFHHGHLKKNDQLPILFAAQFPQMWGSTVKRYCHTGHRHHVEEKEHSGITIIQHATLAARDAYASRGGWISERQVTSMSYHAKFGQVARTTVTPEMLEA